MKKTLPLSLVSLALLTGCGWGTDLNQQTANHIARPAFMVERNIPAGQFNIPAWERMHDRYDVATVYIEGDADMDPEHLNSKIKTNGFFGADASPDNPVGLHLASRDLSRNLGYLARPCQYMKYAEKKGCDPKYWNEDRFAPEVIEAYNAALNDMAARWDITKFHLVGFGGGANIAAVLAGTRDDVLTLRTVAGDLNPRFVDNVKNITPVSSNAVLAVDYGATLSKVPQHHFIGAADDIVTPGTYHSYRQAIGLTDCMHYSLIQDADHTRGWVNIWPELLKAEPQCATLHDLDGPLPPLADFPGNYDKVKGFSK